MKLYLDNCAYNRPYDDKEQMSVRLEAEAKLYIQAEIRVGEYDLVWSYMNDFENSENPYDEQRESIQVWEDIAKWHCPPNDAILQRGIAIERLLIRHKDALHLACAIESGADCFITTDTGILKKKDMISGVAIYNPIDFVRKMEEQDGSNDSF
jgi:hypothetical protein